MAALPTAEPHAAELAPPLLRLLRRRYRTPRPAFVFLLAVAGWAVLAAVAGPAHADTGQGAGGPRGVTQRTVDVVAPLAHLAADGTPARADALTHRPTVPPALQPVVTGAAQTLPDAVAHGVALAPGQAVRMPAAPPAIGRVVAGLTPGQGAPPAGPAAEPAAAPAAAGHPSPVPVAGPAAAPGPAPITPPRSAAPAADVAPVPTGGGAQLDGRDATALPRPRTQPQPPAQLGAPSVPDPLRGPTLPLPAGPEAPTPAAPGSCHAFGGHVNSVEAAGIAFPVLARAGHVLDTDPADDELGAVLDPGSRPD